MIKKILLISGDPYSINSEIIYKSYIKLNKSLKKRIYLISNFDLINEQLRKLGYFINLQKVKNLEETVLSEKLKILDVKLNFKDPFLISRKESSNFVKNSLLKAHHLAQRNDVIGIVNCPIDKGLLHKNNLGVTEFLASKCNIKKNSEVMLISNEKISVCPITTHTNLRNIPKAISSKLIITKIKTIQHWFKKKFKKKPKICILGLNPHNGELLKNSEERKIIIPSIKKLKKMKIDIKGPYPADTIFINNYKNFNVIVGMYHDQVLAPFKSLYKFEAINITLGLNYNRVSPDHGTAIDLIGKDKANETSLLKCINFINKLEK